MTMAEPTTVDRPSRRAMVLTAIPVIGLAIAVDQATKSWALHHLAGRSPRHVAWTLQLDFSLNSGMAFSLGRGAGGLVVPLAIAVVALVLVTSRSLAGPLAGVAVGLVVGGAVSNLVDRLARSQGGAVIDFIDFQWWPIFNLADASIVVGGLALALVASRRSPG